MSSRPFYLKIEFWVLASIAVVTPYYFDSVVSAQREADAARREIEERKQWLPIETDRELASHAHFLLGSLAGFSARRIALEGHESHRPAELVVSTLEQNPKLERMRIRSRFEVRAGVLTDPWGGAVQVTFSSVGTSPVLHLVSAGPDRATGSDDDIEVTSGPG